MIDIPRKVRDITGYKFGRLTVRELADIHGGKAYWRCDCMCGGETVVRGAKLVEGRIVSCGCQRADPIIRQAARLKVPARRRKQIALKGGAATAKIFAKRRR